MKIAGILMVGIFLLMASFNADAKLSKLSGYFVQKALNDETVKKLVVSSSNGEMQPVIISEEKPNKFAADNPSLTEINVRSLDFAQDGDVTRAFLVFDLNNQYQISQTFVSDNMNQWTEEDGTIKIKRLR